MSNNTRKPHSIDVHVGNQLRIRRQLLKMSQEAIGDILDVTFQQVQKYERGSNRLSASKLYLAAAGMNVPISYFFDGLDKIETSDVGISDAANDFIRSHDGVKFAAALAPLGITTRNYLLNLIRHIAVLDGAESFK